MPAFSFLTKKEMLSTNVVEAINSCRQGLHGQLHQTKFDVQWWNDDFSLAAQGSLMMSAQLSWNL